MQLFAAILLLLSLTIAPAWSQTAKTAAELGAYTGADREKILFEGAKREGKLVWYTTLATDQNKQIAAVFEKKYPGISVDTFRTGSSALAQRLLTEAKARRYIADAIETTPPGLMTFRDSQLLLPYTSPHLARVSRGRQGTGDQDARLLDHRARILRRLCLTTSATSMPPMCRKTSTA